MNYENAYQKLVQDGMSRSFLVKKIQKYEKCPEGYYKIALFLDRGEDYHFYRQNSDGTWSHKPAKYPVTNLDFYDNVIYDPEKCDRHTYDFDLYGQKTPGNRGFLRHYDELIGYFAINVEGRS